MHGIIDRSLPELEALVADLGEPRFRTKQLVEWLWKRGAASYDDMTNLSKAFRDKLAEVAPLERARIAEQQVSGDGTIKFLIEYVDGVLVEAVGLPSADGRLTVCMSTQAGCAMGCTFCATGQLGLTRNLTCGEMAEQVRLVGDTFGRRVTNVVAMGQGEPFANYDQTLAALRILNSPDAFGIGARHITVSTAGLLDGIRRFGTEPEQFTLAVSLHSAIQETRDRIMPGMRGQTLDGLRAAMLDYAASSGRRPSLEYALVAGASDTSGEVGALRRFARSVGAHVNLIPINAIPGSDAQPTDRFRARDIVEELEAAGIATSLRAERGADIAAACGQLALSRLERDSAES